MDEEGSQRRYDVLYKYVLSCFLKESNDKKSQSDEQEERSILKVQRDKRHG